MFSKHCGENICFISVGNRMEEEVVGQRLMEEALEQDAAMDACPAL